LKISFITFIPGFIAWYVATRYSVSRALLLVVLPVMLLLPSNFRFDFPGYPGFNFNQTAFLAVGAVFFFRDSGHWKFSRMDLWVGAIVLSGFTTDYLRGTFSDGIRVLVDMSTSCVLPYVLAKGVIERDNRRIEIAKQIVLLLAFVGAFSLYEFRFGVNIFQRWLRDFFPLDQSEWVTQLRWGYARIAGPYSHAILAGTILAVGLVLHYYLTAQGHWKKWDLSWLPTFGIAKPVALGLAIAAGLAMTMSRGPWLAAGFGLLVVFTGRMKDHRKALGVIVLMLLLGGATAAQMLLKYANGQRETAATTEEETAIYRRDLVPMYMPYVEEAAPFGWGRVHTPRLAYMPSIDNHYLLLAVVQGYVGLAVFLITLCEAVMTVVGSAKAARTAEERAFAFTMFGGIAGIAVSIAMVYLGMQLHQLFYFLIGWSEGFRQVVGRRGTSGAQPAMATVGLRQRILT
jgi:hypothetical protein